MAGRNLPLHTEPAPGGESRPAVIIAALLYLITAYQRTPCPCVALCIVRHLDCIAGHAGADPIVRQICNATRDTWALAAAGVRPPNGTAAAVPQQTGHTAIH